MSKLTYEQAKQKMLEKTSYSRIGIGQLTRMWGLSRANVIKLKEEVKGDKSHKQIKIERIKSTEIATGGSTTTKQVDNEKGTLKSEIDTKFDPKDDIELAALHKIDLTKYKIVSYWSKLKPNGHFNSSVLATLRKAENDFLIQKDIIFKELSESFPHRKVKSTSRLDSPEKFVYEINIPDAHFGKMSWAAETGEDYDLKIAEEQYTEAVDYLLSLIDTSQLSSIIFPIGNDMINIDSRRNQTYGGTPQDSDSRFFKIVKTVKEILIRTINKLSAIAPVQVIVISGNHDPEAMFMIGEMLDAYYHKDDNVNVDNTPKQRKYVQYGKNGFLYTHGNEEKHQDLGLIFATEEPKLWADTEFRFAKLGHFHHNRKMNYLSINEYQGFQVQVLPSLSGSDAWHYSKGYMSKKQAKAFLYHATLGQVAEFTFSI